MTDLPYHPYYCEENAWQICRRLEGDGCDIERLFMVFTFSRSSCVPMRFQRSVEIDSIVCWDYHAFVVETRGVVGAFVWDPESRLESPVLLADYLDATFLQTGPPSGRALFRVVSWPVAQTEFASDRRHMWSHGRYTEPPPLWPAIGEGHTLPLFIDPEGDRFGSPLSTAGLRDHFHL